MKPYLIFTKNMKKINKFIIIGSGQLGNFIFQMAKEIENVECIGYIKKKKDDSSIKQLKYLGTDDILKSTPKDIEVFPAVGDLKNRKIIIDNLKSLGFKIIQLIHPSSFVHNSSEINNSTLTYNAFVSNNVKILDNSIIGTGSYVHHNSSIGSNCLLGGNTKIGASVDVGDNVLFGIGSTVASKKIKIGSDSKISSGSVVLSDVEVNSVVMGNPARRVNLK